MASHSYNFGITAGAIRNDLIYSVYGENYAGYLISYSILGSYSDNAIVPVGIYNFGMVYQYDNINGTISVAQAGDTTPPTISGPSSVSFVQGSINSNSQLLSTYYSASDNVAISQFYVGGSVFYGTPGTYNPTLYAIDTSGNQTTLNISITITSPPDTSGPIISGPNSITMIQGQFTLNYILNLYIAEDPSGISIKRLRGDFSGFNLAFTDSSWNDYSMNVGSSTIYVEARDGQNNVTFKNVSLTVQQAPDTTPPTISSDITTLDFYKSTYPNGVDPNVQNNLLTNITTVGDNLDPNPTRELDKNLQLLFGSVNTITYGIRARDNANNVSNYIYITFNYIDDVTPPPDTTPPSISLAQTNFTYFSSQYPSGVTANKIQTDVIAQASSNETVTYSFEPTIQNMTDFGSQGYLISALDSSGNRSEWLQFYVNYVNATPDTTGPTITGPSSVSFLASDNKTITDLIALYTLFDASGNVFWYQLPSIIFNTPGTFNVLLRAEDLFGNLTSKNVEVIVTSTLPQTDNTPPSIVSKTGSFTFQVTTSQGLTAENFIELYLTITDPSGVKSTSLSPNVAFNTPSTYLTNVIAIDNFNNVASVSLTINVVFDGEPVEPVVPIGRLIDKIILDGEDITARVKVGFTLIEKIDTELDVGTLILPVTSRSEPYKPFTKVFVYYEDVEEPVGFYVNDDTVSSVTSGVIRYQHTINIVEPTKILERYRCQKMAFTQPINENAFTYTLKDVVDRINLNSPLKVSNQAGYIDSFEPTLYAKLDTIISPQFVLDGLNLFEAFNRVFSFIGGIPRLKLNIDGTNELGITYFNALKGVIDNNDILTSTKALNSDYYVGSASISVDNATTEYATVKYPSKAFMGVRTDSDILTSENTTIEVPFPIYEITKLVLNVPVVDFNIGNGEQFVQFDATKFVVEKALYDTLPMVNDSNIDDGTLHKNNALYYNKGERKILNMFNTSNGMTWIENIWASFNMNLAPKNTINMMLLTYFGVRSWFFINSTFSKLTFQIEYRTLLTSKLRVYKDLKEEFIGTLLMNQPERVVDLPAIANNLKGVINRVGNGDITMAKNSSSIENAFQVGQYTADNYIVTSVENAFFPSHLRSVAYFTKNYNGLSKFVGVDAELRYIPNPFESITTHIRKDQMVVISDEVYAINGSNYASTKFYDTLANYLKQLPNKVLTSNVSSTLQVAFNSQTNTHTLPREMVIIPSNVDVTSITIGLTATNVSATIQIKNVLTGAIVLNQTYTGNQQITISSNALIPGETYRWSLFQPSPYTTLAGATLTVNYIKLEQFGKYSGYFLWGTGGSSQGLNGNYSMITPDISAVGSSIKIDYRMKNDYSAGDRVDQNVSGFLDGMKAVPYADFNARFTFFQFAIAELKEPANNNARVLLSQRLPQVSPSDYENVLIQTPIFNYIKDTQEVFAMTYQMHILVDDKKDGHIVLGKEILDKMFRAKDTDDLDFYVYGSNTEVYKKDANEKVKGTFATMQPGNLAITYQITYDFNSKYIRIEFIGDLSSYKSFAIGNKHGDLIIGFNNYHPFTNAYNYKRIFYLTFTNSR